LWWKKAGSSRVESSPLKFTSSSRRSTLDGAVSDIVNAQPNASEDNVNGDRPTTSLSDPPAVSQAEEALNPPAAPQAEDAADPPAAPQVEEDIVDQPYYGVVEANSNGQPIGDTVSLFSQIELNTMVKRGQLEISKKPAGDDPFGDSNAAASASITVVA